MKSSRSKFIVRNAFVRPGVLAAYYALRRNGRRPREQLLFEQAERLGAYVRFCRKHVPYYRALLSGVDLDLDPARIRESFGRIPIMTKETLKERREELSPPLVYRLRSKAWRTGGSTGTPLAFRLGTSCARMGPAIRYRGWSYGGYRLGDRMAVLAGGSLVGKKTTWKARLKDYLSETRSYSSYGVDDALHRMYFEDMRAWQPQYLRGYVGSIVEFGRFLERNALELRFDAIFTTGEMLGDCQRALIQKTLGGEVFDTYGLNDGGVSAFECRFHRGMHVDLERGYLEVVGDDGDGVVDRPGRVLATSFRNKATPFLRYDTGDFGVLTEAPCPCGSPYPLLVRLLGRKLDPLRINGCSIGSAALTILMSRVAVLRYQFIQMGENRVVVNLEKSDGYTPESETFIRDSLFSQVGPFDLEFRVGKGEFRDAAGSKHRVVINELAPDVPHFPPASFKPS